MRWSQIIPIIKDAFKMPNVLYFLNVLVKLAAIWGAISGTLALLKDRTNVTVKRNCQYYQDDQSGEIHQNLLSISAIYYGKNPLRIVRVGLRGPNKKIFYLTRGYITNESESKLPITLSNGDTVSIYSERVPVFVSKGYYIPFDMAFFEDYFGRRYYAKVSLKDRVKRLIWWHFGRINDENKTSHENKNGTFYKFS